MNELFRTKSLDDLVAGTQEKGHQLKKVLGPWNLVALGVGAIIGAGIFATIGTAAAGDAARPGAGPGLMLSFVITAIVCGFTALCYAEFASMVPVSGSAYTYSYATLGQLIAWIIGWDLIIEYAIGNVAVAISWSTYFNTFLEGLGIHIPRWLTVEYVTAKAKMPEVVASAPHIFGVPIVVNLLAASIVAVITIVLVWGIRESARFNFLMVALKLVVLGFFVIVSFKFVKPANWTPFAPNGTHGILTGAAIVFFAYIGFDAVSTTAEEAKNPKRDMPIGIIGSLIVCTVIYIIVAAVFTGMIPFPSLVKTMSTQQAEPLTLAMKFVNMPNWMVGVVALGSVIAHTAVLLVFQLGQPRIFFAMARDGLLPPWIAKVHPKYRTPHVATILTGVGVGVFSMFTSLDSMVNLTNIGTLFAFMLVCIGVMVLRIKDPHRERSFKVPGGAFFLPLLGAVSCVGLAYYLPPDSWFRFFAWLGCGGIIYATYGLRHIVYRGRLSRLEFFLRYLAVIGIAVAIELVVLAGGYLAGHKLLVQAIVAASIAGTALYAILVVRRLHDLDRPGKHYWLLLIPVYGLYLTLLLFFKRGTDGPNRFDFVAPEGAVVPGVPPRHEVVHDFNPEQQLPSRDVDEEPKK